MEILLLLTLAHKQLKYFGLYALQKHSFTSNKLVLFLLFSFEHTEYACNSAIEDNPIEQTPRGFWQFDAGDACCGASLTETPIAC